MSVVKRPEGLDLFEVYEKDGALLLVTSSGYDARQACRSDEGDIMVRRPWATSAEPVFLPPRSAGAER